MTANDIDVLLVVSEVCGGTGDGFMPHGASQWTAIRRLVKMGFVKTIYNQATCESCAVEHDGPAFALTEQGEHRVFEEM